MKIIVSVELEEKLTYIKRVSVRNLCESQEKKHKTKEQ